MTARRQALATRLALAVVSTAAGAAAAWLLASPLRPRAETVRLVDTSGTLRDLLRARAEAGPLDARGPELAAVLLREPVPAGAAAVIAPGLGAASAVPDPLTGYRNRPSAHSAFAFREHPAGRIAWRTNAAGFRADREVAAERPDVRVIVAGDSHTEGVVAAGETFSALLELRLAAEDPGRTCEVLNGACGGYGPHQAARALERWAELAPDALVFVVYGGNDFLGALSWHRYLHRLPPGPEDPLLARNLEAARAVSPAGVAQVLAQAARFWILPGELDLAVEATCEVTAALAERCRELDVRLLCVYLPSVAEAQPELAREELVRAVAAYGAPPEAVERAGEPGRAWLAELARRGIPAVDLLPVLAASDGPAYWRADLHLSVRGHALAADAIAGPLADLVRGR